MSVPDYSTEVRQRPAWELFINFTMHCLTGVLTVLVHYALMYLALGIGAKEVVATSIGFVGGALSRFLLSYHHVFTPSRNRSAAALRFLVSLGIQFVFNALIFSVLLTYGLSTWPAQLLTTLLLTFVNYAMYRLWVFA